MKISVVCICVFLFCTLYWAFGTSLGLASAENAVLSTSISASIASAENASASATNDGDSEPSEHNVIQSDGNLEPSADIHSSIEEFSDQEKELLRQQEYAFVEAVSQNSGVAHEVAGTGPGVIHTLVDSATLELQEKAEELSSAAAAAASTATTTTSHHNETPSLEGNNLTNGKPPVIIETSNEPIDKENIYVEIKLEQRSEEISDSNNTQQTDQPGTEVPSIEPKSNNVTEQKGEAHEDIPSFSEWTQKQLEEAERKKEQVNTSAHSHHTNGKPSSGIKKRWKNYASPDCGSKIIAANPEAVSAGSVLSSSRDEYKLNTCTSRIWFIVELCEAIQAKKIDLANFELFSSSPKDFSISVSDRFPSRDWSSVGHFTAKDERDIQSFDLHPHLFGKYIKFEMHSHHGSEHYCPISLFRVYGTSEFEVLETENQLHGNVAEEDDDDEALDADDGEPTKNLFSSATDTVISIVKKAAQVLGNKANTSTDVKVQQNATVIKYTPLISTCTTPSHLVICDNCSDLLFGNLFELLSCNSKQLTHLVTQPIIKNALYNTDVCSKFGLEFRTTPTGTGLNSYKSYISSFFSSKYVAAMCNTVAVNECKVVLNVSSSNATATLTSQDTIDKLMSTKIPEPTLILSGDPVSNTAEISTTGTVTEQFASSAEVNSSEAMYTSQIKPTKTLSPEEDLNLTDASVNIEHARHEQTVHPTSSLLPQSGQNESSSTGDDKPALQQVEHIEMSSEVVSDIETATESSETLDDHLEALVTELNGDSTLNVAATTISPPTTPQGQKESVFLRLSNRIKALERNMSLSSQYLEELSRRYKKQVEEMQRLLDKTINTLSEENKKKDERSYRLEEQITSLRDAVESLIAEKNSWMHTTYWVFLSGVIMLGILLFCRRNTEFKQPRVEDKTKNMEVQRRKSVDVITHKTPVKKKRRPSEETLVVGGTYTHLMIDDVDGGVQKSKDKKRKKKKQQLQRSNSITTLNEETDNDDRTTRTVNSDKGFYFAPKSASSQIWRRQESAPPNLPLDWVDNTFGHTGIQDIPFVLEESEHSSLEPMSYIPVLNQKNLANSEKRKENGNAIQASAFTITATDSRSKRMFQRQKNGNGKHKSGHKKSASFDETKRCKTPSPIETDTTSLSNSLEDPTRLQDAPKKEKKSAFRKLFRNFTFK